MKFAIILTVLLLAVASVQAQNDLLTIDDFTDGIQSVFIILPANPDLPETRSDFYQSPDGETSAHILGGERDIILTVVTGNQNNIIFAQTTGPNISPPQFSVAVPQGASGIALLQYDGLDNSTALDITPGLNPVLRDLTVGGTAGGIRTTLTTDIETTYDFFFYDGAGTECSRSITIPSQDEGIFQDFDLAYTSFTGGCDLSDIAAIEIQVNGGSNVDTIITFIGVYGDLPVSPSPPPSPQPPGGFTWYTFDDDDNGRSPCSTDPERRTYFLDDNEIIYYYFYGFEYEAAPSSSDASSNIAYTAAAVFIGIIAAFF